MLEVIVTAVLAAFVVSEVVRFVPRYRQLKEAVAQGDTQARNRIYARAIVFEWVSALLALIALKFNWARLNPKYLELNSANLPHLFTGHAAFDQGMIGGMAVGVVLGGVALAIAGIRAQRSRAGRADAPTQWWRKLLPDFSALLPVTLRERAVWAAIAISAGVCEEVVFRGWLLATLHHLLALQGLALLVVAAVLFGLAHAYQKSAGIVLTGLAGLFFCLLYVETGSLLLPICLHTLVDLRFAFLPAPRSAVAQKAAYA